MNTSTTEKEFDINDVPVEVFQESEAASLPTEILRTELMRRGFLLEDHTEYDEATGLLKWKGDVDYYFDPETRKLVPTEEAYKRATSGW